jgi:hypothetical protein
LNLPVKLTKFCGQEVPCNQLRNVARMADVMSPYSYNANATNLLAKLKIDNYQGKMQIFTVESHDG